MLKKKSIFIIPLSMAILASCVFGKKEGVWKHDLKLSESHYKDVDFSKIDSAKICEATLFSELDTNHVVVAGTYRIDSTFDYVRYSNTDINHAVYLLHFDNDSTRDFYQFCIDFSWEDRERGDLYRFSSGNIHRTICEVDTANLRIIFEIKDAYFKRSEDSVLLKDVILWNDIPKKHAMHQSFILGSVLW
jgi:hypothetical protein